MSNKTLPPYVAHFAGNQIPSMMGVEGTLGTADVGGTARVLPIAMDPTTGALFVNNLGDAGAGTITGKETSGSTLTGKGVMIAGTDAGGTVYYPQIDENGYVHTYLNSLLAGENFDNNVLNVEQEANYFNGSASALVQAGTGRIFGFVVNSHTTGSLKFWDSGTNSGSIIFNTMSFPAGPQFKPFPVAIPYSTGLYITTGGTIDYTVLYK